MGATNSTLNYQLSQFIATDKPAWLQDYNGDMEKIDVGINTAKVAADTAQNTANSAVSSIGTVTSDITSLQTDVLAHTNDITDLQGDVNTIESLIGNGTPTAGDHTLIGAINTNTAEIANLKSGEATAIGAASGSGAKTVALSANLDNYKFIEFVLTSGGNFYLLDSVILPVSLFKLTGVSNLVRVKYDTFTSDLYYENNTTIKATNIGDATICMIYGIK